jgi:nicotinamide-nucleotide adenylyltransferase
MSIGFFIGRFQPFHLGHLSAVKQALMQVDFLIIGIGSAQYSNTSDNPFTAEEREKMIRAALLENEISEDQFRIIPIPDIHDNPKWPAHVQGLVGDFEVVFVGEENLAKELFETYTDIPVKIVKKEINICATDIRKMIKERGDFSKYISNSTKEFIKEAG